MLCLAGGMQLPLQAQNMYDFPKDKGVIHPGLLHTQKTFDRIKRQLEEGNERTKQAYHQLETNCVANQTWIWGPNVEILRGIAGNENYANVARSGSVIYQYALRYKITGNTRYADLVVEMLNLHAQIVKNIGGNTNMSLASGLYGYRLAESAELLRDYPGWKPEDFRKFQQWMMDVWFSRCYDFLRRRHDTVEREGNWYHYESNWGAANALTVISIGILCDDPAVYNIGVYYLKRSQACESFSDIECGKGEGYFPWRYKDPRGPYGELNMTSEFGRDQPHCVLAATLQLYSAETMWNQGDNLYAYNGHALAGGIEHLAGWNIFDKDGADKADFDTWPMDLRKAKPWQGAWELNRGRLTPAYYIATNHYQNRMHVPMKYAQRSVEAIGFDGLWNINENNGKDWLHYNALMYDDIPTATPYTELAGSIRQGTAVTISPYPEMSGIHPGTELTLIASLPDTVRNTGKWRWVLPSGEERNGTMTTNGSELKLTANQSGFYRAYYTDKNGLENQQLFSLAVLGDAAFHTATQYASFNGTTYENDSVLFIPKNSSVEFGVNSSGWSYGETYKWYVNGKEITGTDRTMRLEKVLSDRKVSVEVTNESGAKRSFNYHLTVSEVTPYISVNEIEKGILTQIRVNAGDQVKLWGEPILMAQGGTSKWTDSEEKLLSEEDVFSINPDKTSEYKLTYTSPTGKTSTWNFHVEVVALNTLYEGEYLLEDKETGLYLTNVLDNDTLIFSELLDPNMQETQKWTLKAESGSEGRYKITSTADGRYIHNKGLLKKSLYTAAYQTYNVYCLTGSNIYALQNGGKATPTWWKLDDNFNLATDGTAQEEFPFILHFLDPNSIVEIEEEATSGNELKVYVEGRSVRMPEGCKLYTVNGLEVYQTENLQPGIYIVTRGSQRTKIRIL